MKHEVEAITTRSFLNDNHNKIAAIILESIPRDDNALEATISISDCFKTLTLYYCISEYSQKRAIKEITKFITELEKFKTLLIEAKKITTKYNKRSRCYMSDGADDDELSLDIHYYVKNLFGERVVSAFSIRTSHKSITLDFCYSTDPKDQLYKEGETLSAALKKLSKIQTAFKTILTQWNKMK